MGLFLAGLAGVVPVLTGVGGILRKEAIQGAG